MFLAIHAAAGALIGAKTSHPIFALVFGFISHFILDLIPHGDEQMGEEYNRGCGKIKYPVIVGADILVTIFATLIIIFFDLPFNPWCVALGIVGGLLPDVLQMAYAFSRHPWLKNFFDLHKALHYKHGRFTMRLRYGFLFQAGILVLLFLITI
jgi:hypothetical protein